MARPNEAILRDDDFSIQCHSLSGKHDRTLTASLDGDGKKLDIEHTPARTDTNTSSSSTIGQNTLSRSTLPVDGSENPHAAHGSGNARSDQLVLQYSWLHIIILDKKFGKKQVPVDISKHKTDYELFVKLNREWRKHRGRWRALTCLKDIRLTKVMRDSKRISYSR